MKRPVFNAANPKQKACIEAFYDKSIREIYYGGAKMCGKSYLGAFLFIMQALRYPGTHYFIARKRITDLTKFLVPSLLEVGKNYGIEHEFKVNLQRNIVEFYNTSKIFLLEAAYYPSDPLYSRYGSMQITQGWIEEGGEVDLDAKVNLQASIGRWKNQEYDIPVKILITCNPANNFIYSVYNDHISGKLAPDTVFITALPDDNPYCTSDYLNNLRASLPEMVARRLLQGLWDFENVANLFTFEKITKAFRSDRIKNQYARKVISIDVALQGGDRCVAVLYEGTETGGHYKIIHDEEQSNARELIGLINLWSDMYDVPKRNIVFDAVGVGSYIRDYLPSAIPFITGRPAKKNFGFKTELIYANARAECLYLLSKLMKEDMISIEADSKQQEKITMELMAYEIIHNEKMLDCTRKDEIKSRIGRSTDYSDAMYMALFRFLKTNNPLPTKIGW